MGPGTISSVLSLQTGLTQSLQEARLLGVMLAELVIPRLERVSLPSSEAELAQALQKLDGLVVVDRALGFD